MLMQIKNLILWSNLKLQNKLGQRGAEMVEYAIVLACIAAVGVYFYSTSSGDADNSLKGTLEDLWDEVQYKAGVKARPQK